MGSKVNNEHIAKSEYVDIQASSLQVLRS